jgi:hypothetical protein
MPERQAAEAVPPTARAGTLLATLIRASHRSGMGPVDTWHRFIAELREFGPPHRSEALVVLCEQLRDYSAAGLLSGLDEGAQAHADLRALARPMAAEQLRDPVSALAMSVAALPEAQRPAAFEATLQLAQPLPGPDLADALLPLAAAVKGLGEPGAVDAARSAVLALAGKVDDPARLDAPLAQLIATLDAGRPQQRLQALGQLRLAVLALPERHRLQSSAALAAAARAAPRAAPQTAAAATATAAPRRPAPPARPPGPLDLLRRLQRPG